MALYHIKTTDEHDSDRCYEMETQKSVRDLINSHVWDYIWNGWSVKMHHSEYYGNNYVECYSVFDGYSADFQLKFEYEIMKK